MVDDQAPTARPAVFVPFHLMEIVHQRHGIQLATLDQYRDLIIEEVDGVALRVGRLLREARQAAPEAFAEWVERELPFGHDTAKRLMAISAAYEKLPEDVVASLPRPWQAMYALHALPEEALRQGVESGALTPWTTVRRAQQYVREWKGMPVEGGKVLRCDVAAGALMQFPASTLTPSVRDALRKWLNA